MFKMVMGESHMNHIEMLVVLLRCLNLGCLLLLRVVLPRTQYLSHQALFRDAPKVDKNRFYFFLIFLFF